jgi:hopanoid biosynthesis associated RND transporter like protein HpnN
LLVSLITRTVDFSRRHAGAVVLAALLLTLACGRFASTHFKINTDVNQLLSADLPWRKQEKMLEAAFPQKVDTLLVVIDGATPDTAENAATALSANLQAQTNLFTSVIRPDAIPFFRKNGFLFLSKDELGSILDQLIQAQPMLGALTSDPSLRGLFSALGMMAQGVQAGAVPADQLDKPLNAIADTVEAALKGEDKPMSWQDMMSGPKPQARDLRKFVLAKPVLNYAELEPGKTASDAVRAAADQLSLNPAHGVHVRLTGSVPLNDEEFASVANGTGFATALSGILVFVVLLLALHSLRIILPILLTLTVGLVATTAFALAAVGSLNLISVAFAVMFIGIAVDFGIQFGVRYRDQHHNEPDHARAMSRTAGIIAIPLSMAAGSTALGFLAFIPTAYRGVSELGLIAGGGMIIAYLLNITLLPALLTFARPPAEREAIGFSWAAPIDRFIVAQRSKILVAAALLGLASLLITTQLRFDFDPLNLKDPHTESVSTLFDLMSDPDFGAYDVEILRPSLADAQALNTKLSALPEVDHVMTLASFVPDDQDTKLALISDANMLLGPTLGLTPQPTPNDAAVLESLRKTAAMMRQIASPAAIRLAKALDDVVAKNDPALLQRLDKNLVKAMQARMDMVKEALSAERVTPDAITDDLRRDWVTPDGRYLLQVYPKGNPRDHTALTKFTDAVRQVAPDASGSPISIQESGHTVTSAFIHAGCYALIAIALLAFMVLRRAGDVAQLLAPLILAGILTLATIVIIRLPLNFANIIALPLLLSLGVSYAIYFVSYTRAGLVKPLQSSMARAVLFSAATVLVAFGSLALSSHPGTAGMGELLTVALLYSVLSTFFILPALLANPKDDKG